MKAPSDPAAKPTAPCLGSVDARRRTANLPQHLSFEYRTDFSPVPPEYQMLDRLARPDAPRPKNSDALSALTPNTVVHNPVRAPLPQLGAQPLRTLVISGRVDVLEVALLVTQIEKLGASKRRIEHFEVEILRRRLHCLEKSNTMVFNLGDRGRLVARRVVNAE